MLCSSESTLIMTASLHANTFIHVPVRYIILPLAKRPTFQKLKSWYRNPNSTHQHHLHNQLFTSSISFFFHVTHVHREKRNHEWKCYLCFEVLHFIMPTSSPNVLWQCCLCHLKRQVFLSWGNFQVFGNDSSVFILRSWQCRTENQHMCLRTCQDVSRLLLQGYWQALTNHITVSQGQGLPFVLCFLSRGIDFLFTHPSLDSFASICRMPNIYPIDNYQNTTNISFRYWKK